MQFKQSFTNETRLKLKFKQDTVIKFYHILKLQGYSHDFIDKFYNARKRQNYVFKICDPHPEISLNVSNDEIMSFIMWISENPIKDSIPEENEIIKQFSRELGRQYEW